MKLLKHNPAGFYYLPTVANYSYKKGNFDIKIVELMWFSKGLIITW